MNLEKKRLKEQEIVSLMIQIYCKNHNDINEEELVKYAKARIEHCPMMATKTFCSQCKIHCYRREKLEEIKKVMRYSGPRMILYHPLLAIKHALKI